MDGRKEGRKEGRRDGRKREIGARVRERERHIVRQL